MSFEQKDSRPPDAETLSRRMDLQRRVMSKMAAVPLDESRLNESLDARNDRAKRWHDNHRVNFNTIYDSDRQIIEYLNSGQIEEAASRMVKLLEENKRAAA